MRIHRPIAGLAAQVHALLAAGALLVTACSSGGGGSKASQDDAFDAGAGASDAAGVEDSEAADDPGGSDGAATDSLVAADLGDTDLCSDGPKVSPFVCMRFDAACSVDVQLAGDDAWYGLVSVDGVATATLIDVAKAECGSDEWRKRLAEDLYGLLLLAGADPGSAVDLVLTDLASGGAVDKPGVASTEDNRDAVKGCWEANDACVE